MLKIQLAVLLRVCITEAVAARTVAVALRFHGDIYVRTSCIIDYPELNVDDPLSSLHVC
jgi:hypothetical protein